jgi:hypothetical protein
VIIFGIIINLLALDVLAVVVLAKLAIAFHGMMRDAGVSPDDGGGRR